METFFIPDFISLWRRKGETDDKNDRNSPILTEAVHRLGTVTENPRAISRIAKSRAASLQSIWPIRPAGSGYFDFGYSNSGSWGRQTTRQYLRPGQVIIGSTLVPGRLVNRARVHAPALTSAVLVHHIPRPASWLGICGSTAGRLCQFRLALEYERHFSFY